jgi:mono/diheme cytochrome c family protein
VTRRGAGRLAALALAASLASGSAHAAGAPGAASGPPADAQRAAKGNALYAEHCSHCHGFGMVNSGNVVPDLREFPSDDEARFVETVTHGRNNRMPPWGDLLSRAEIEALWAYVRTKGQK